jgi:hypothetical protein
MTGTVREQWCGLRLQSGRLTVETKGERTHLSEHQVIECGMPRTPANALWLSSYEMYRQLEFFTNT